MDPLVTSRSASGHRPSGDIGSWAARFDPSAIPVLADTAAQLEALRESEDAVDAHLLNEVIGDDPLMSLRVMAHVARLRGERDGGGPETLLGALVMFGIPPFFTSLERLETVDARLAGRPDAWSGFSRVLSRSYRAARFAMAFAVHRMDHDAAVIHQAALLHDFAELLLWIEAPDLALEISRRQARDPTLRSSVAQRDVLGIELSALQQHLMLLWKLPPLLVAISDDNAPRETMQTANVRLAIRVARHSAAGWDNAALPDDFEDIAALLQLAPLHVQRLLVEVDST